MYSACKLNKHGDNIQLWSTPFPIWNQSIVPCPVLTVASWPAYRFLRRQVRWSHIPIMLRIFHSLLWSTQSKGFSRINEVEVDVFLAFSCFFYDPTDIGNLISGSFAFSKSSLYIWKFSVHVLLKPGPEDFEHHFASMWGVCNCAAVWTWSSVAYWAPTDLGSSSFSVLSFCLFILFMGFSRQEDWSGLPFPFPVDHVLSELFTMTHPSWVALHGMAYKFHWVRQGCSPCDQIG